MYGLSRTPQREKVLLFSLPIWTNHTWAVVREGEQASIKRYGDLNGQVVCWARGSSYGELFSLAGLGRMDAREASDDDGALRMAGAGRCRAALITLETDDPKRALRHPGLAATADTWPCPGAGPAHDKPPALRDGSRQPLDLGDRKDQPSRGPLKKRAGEDAPRVGRAC